MTNSNYVEKKHRQKNVLANMYGKVPFFIIWRVSKGQLVSEGNFGVLESPKKQISFEGNFGVKQTFF